MTSVSEKRRRLNEIVSIRLLEMELDKSNQVPTGYLVFSLLMIPVCIGAGVFVADYQYLLGLERYERSADYNYTVDGYSIMFVSSEENHDIEGNWGFTYRYRSDDIFINKELLLNRNWVQIRRTCEHELIHNLGVGEDHHDIIDIYEEQVETPVCNKLMNKIQ